MQNFDETINFSADRLAFERERLMAEPQITLPAVCKFDAIFLQCKLFLRLLLGSVRLPAMLGLADRIISATGIVNSDYQHYFAIVGVYTSSN